MNNILLTSFYAVYFCEICRICAKFEMPVSSISAVWSHSKGVVVVFLHGGVEVGRWTGPFLWLVFCWQGCASTPQDKTQLDNLRQAAEDLRLATEAAAAGTLRKQLLTALQVIIHTQMQIVSVAVFRLNWDCLIAPLILFFWSFWTHVDRHPFNSIFFQDNLGKPAPERLNQSGFQWSKRW